jgi:CRISPR-associated protein Csx17
MAELTLDGCRTTPLGSYLAALGVLRAVTRLLDPQATGRWRQQRFVLGTGRFATVAELASTLRERFEPVAVVSPWNAGSGFAGNGRNTTAEAALDRVRAATDPRLDQLRAAVLAGDAVVAEGRRRGWGGRGDELWDKARKRDVLALCRREFPDAVLPWLDAVAALGQDGDPAFSRLLGTGGNFGRQDLSATYLARVEQAFTHKRSPGWLLAALTGDESVPYLRDAVGQFDPGRAGGIQSSPLEKADDKGFVNPWAFLFQVEGALLFAAAVVRRHGAQNSQAALPFQVRGSTSGHGSSAAGEAPLGELWAPDWAAPARLVEIEHLLAEGRAQWRGKPARTGLDFVRAVATLGVDRGIAAFERHVFVDRLGQNPLAVPAGRVAVERRGGVEPLAGLDGWLDAVRRSVPPGSVAARLRAVEQALFEHARTGGGRELAAVFAAVGRCHEAVSRSGAVRRFAAPLVLANGAELLPLLAEAALEDAELRLALALATARDEPGAATGSATMSGLRPLLSPVDSGPLRPARPARSGGGRGATWPVWLDAPAPSSLAAGLAEAVAGAARRRGMPGAVAETARAAAQLAVRGVRIAFDRGCRLPFTDVQHFVAGRLGDEPLAADLLAGLLTVDWRGCPDRLLGGVEAARAPLGPAVDLLLPFTGTSPVTLALPEGGSRPALLRPGSDWPLLLAGGRVQQVLDDAAFRLRLAGVRHVVQPHQRHAEPARLAAMLLLRVPDGQRLAALRRVSDLPSPVSHPTPEEATT